MSSSSCSTAVCRTLSNSVVLRIRGESSSGSSLGSGSCGMLLGLKSVWVLLEAAPSDFTSSDIVSPLFSSDARSRLSSSSYSS